jgi:hypothetical protein
MHHVRLPHSFHGHGLHPDAVADALWFVAIFLALAVSTWLVFDEVLGINPGVW